MAVNLSIFKDFLTIDGLEIGVASAGIKQEGRKDLVVFKLAESATTAGVFTQNAFCAAPVTICKKHLKETQPRYLMINTGNANAGTGDQGYADAVELCETLANAAGVESAKVLPFSTGVIGELLPVDKIKTAIPKALEAVKADNWYDASEGIMTTDTQPKGYATEFEYNGEKIRISGISKGAGMIKPNMATMLGFIATDAPIAKDVLKSICFEAAEQSFNRITVDGDTSTNDSCMLVATGTASVPAVESAEGELYELLKAELNKAFKLLAQAIVRDGEGATKFVSIEVSECENQAEALRVAYTVAHSPLVKTALFASDANWGRILAAVGRSGVKDMDLSKIQISLDDVQIVENGGRASSYTEEAGTAVMEQQELAIRIQLGRGDANETVWTTDLSHEYVTINAEYRT